MLNKSVSIIFLISALQAADLNVSCRGCAAGKLMLQCDVYVAEAGHREKRSLCEKYAEIVDIDGASAKAAWYYLLAGKPEKALKAANRALKIGQNYAYEYAAYALLLLGKKEEARKAMKTFITKVGKLGGESYFQKDFKTIKRLYPEVDFRGFSF